MFEGRNNNKKHKRIKKGCSGLGFENFSDRITSLINFDMFKKPPTDYKEVSRLTVSEGEMQEKKKQLLIANSLKFTTKGFTLKTRLRPYFFATHIYKN